MFGSAITERFGLMARIGDVWKAAFGLGTAGVASNTLLRSIQLVNGLALFGIVSTWAALLMILLSGMSHAVPVNLLAQLAMGAVLWLNHRCRYGLAASLLVVFMQAAIVGQVWMLGAETGVYLWLLPIIVIPHLLVIGPRQNVWLACHSLLSVLLFCFIVFRQEDAGALSKDQSFAYVSVAWVFFGMGYYGRKLNDAWAAKERSALEKEQSSLVQAEQQTERLERSMTSKIETEQKLVEQLFKVSGLNQFSEKMAEASSEGDIWELAAGQVNRITGAQWVEVALLDSQQSGFQCMMLSAKGVEETDWRTKKEGGLLDVVATTKAVMLANNCREEQDERWHQYLEKGLESVVILPMQVGPSNIGVMTIGSRWSGHFDRMSLPVVQQFAAVVSTHIGLQRAVRELAKSLERSENLLVNVLPPSVAERMKQGETQIADRVDEAAVLFCDMVGFTEYSSSATPEQVLELLQQVFGIMEEQCEIHGVEKIKTIGDAFMAAAGVTVLVPDPAHAMAGYAFSTARRLGDLMAENPIEINFRMGMHVGPVVAGVIGGHRLFFDVWGDTVNVASRMESHGSVGEISCSEEVYSLLKDRWRFEDLGLVRVKGKGEQRMWLLRGPVESDDN